MAESKKREDKRTKNWTFVVYPDECFKNWVEIINEQHIEWVESPLHDKDKNPDGTAKKVHKHVLLMFSSNKSYGQVLEFLKTLGESVQTESGESIKGVTIPQECRNVKGMVRYFAHVDNPEKYQYPVKEVIGHCGIDVSGYFAITQMSRYELLGLMTRYIKQNEITEFIDFSDYCYEYHFDDWFKLCCDNTMYLREIIQSQWKKSQKKMTEVKGKVQEIKELVDNALDGQNNGSIQSESDK